MDLPSEGVEEGLIPTEVQVCEGNQVGRDPSVEEGPGNCDLYG